jgi:hypothetical protein
VTPKIHLQRGDTAINCAGDYCNQLKVGELSLLVHAGDSGVERETATCATEDSRRLRGCSGVVSKITGHPNEANSSYLLSSSNHIHSHHGPELGEEISGPRVEVGSTGPVWPMRVHRVGWGPAKDQRCYWRPERNGRGGGCVQLLLPWTRRRLRRVPRSPPPPAKLFNSFRWCGSLAGGFRFGTSGSLLQSHAHARLVPSLARG